MVANRWLYCGKNRFKFHRFITLEKKLILQNHPQKAYFLFKPSSGGFNWYIRTNK